MASSSALENAHGTPALPSTASPGHSTKPTLTKLKLNHEWMVGEPIAEKDQRHAAVYSILISETGQLAEDLEAHVFALDDTEPKSRKARQRCINRMKGRTKLEVKADGITIVVISTSQTGSTMTLQQTPGVDPRSLNTDGRRDIDSHTTLMGKLKQKTLYQRESKRIQQRERRRAQRRAKTRQCNGKDAEEVHKATGTIDQGNLLDERNELSMFMFYFREWLDAWDLWRAMPFVYINPAKALETTLVQAAAALTTIEEMESYLKLRRSEIISLRRHQARFSSAITHHLEKLMNVKREQFQRKEESSLMKATFNGSQAELEARMKLFTLEELAVEIIDNFLIPCKFVVRSVERKLLETASAELKEKGNALERQFPWYKDLMKPSYPQRTPTFEDVLRLMEWAKNSGQ